MTRRTTYSRTDSDAATALTHSKATDALSHRDCFRARTVSAPTHHNACLWAVPPNLRIWQSFPRICHEMGTILQIVLTKLPILQYSLDNWTMAGYPCPRLELLAYFATTSSAMPLSARRVSLLNSRNNRPLPQNLWD